MKIIKSGLTLALGIGASSAFANAIEHEIAQSMPTPMYELSVAHQSIQPIDGPFYRWQGFSHEWRRFVVLPNEGRVPHRISKLHNYINHEDDVHYHFAQSTGVDGNYMRPKGYLAALESDVVEAFQGVVGFSWRDQLTDGAYPVANNQIREAIHIPVEAIGDQVAQVSLQGIKLDLSCEDINQPDSQPCNSDGMWPYVFRVEIGECDSSTGGMDCELLVDIYRAWTPNKGGFQLPPIVNEVKPLNQSLNYNLDVFYSVILANKDDIKMEPVNHHQELSNLANKKGHSNVVEKSTVAGEFDYAITSINGISFMLTEPSFIEPVWTMLGSDVGHRGRYLAKLEFSIEDQDNNPRDGDYSYRYRMGLWSPITVVNSDAVLALKTQTLLLADSDATIAQQDVSGQLCINSTDQAPAFSRWQNCHLTHWLARWIYGGEERLTDAVDLSGR